MQTTRKNKLKRVTGCRGLCCSSCSRLSVSSSEEPDRPGSSSAHCGSVSRLAHAMVQERLDQMIKESARRKHIRDMKRKVVNTHKSSRFIVMVAMEKRSRDPREDFRRSMMEMIMAKRIEEAKDLRYLLNCYVSMNSEEYRGLILEVFYEVCTGLFLHCKSH